MGKDEVSPGRRVGSGSPEHLNAAPQVFISYRTEDTGALAKSLAVDLREDLRSQNVFRDQEDLIVGERWRDAIERSIAEADMTIFLVGSQWTGEDESGRRRIDTEDDPVRAEVAQALSDGTQCAPLPVLVDIDQPPERLPAAVAPLFEYHVARMTSDELAERESPGYQQVLVAAWESLRQRIPAGVLVLGESGSQAVLDEMVQELRDSDLIDAQHLSRFVSGAYLISPRTIRRGSRRWPDVIVVSDATGPSRILQERIRALDNHPTIRDVSLVGAGAAAALAASHIASGALTGGGTTFSTSATVAAGTSTAGAGVGSSAAAGGMAISGKAVAAIAAGVLTVGAGTATIVATTSDEGGSNSSEEVFSLMIPAVITRDSPDDGAGVVSDPGDSELFEIEARAGEQFSLDLTSMNGGCARSSQWNMRIGVGDANGLAIGDAWPGNYGCQAYGPWEVPRDGMVNLRVLREPDDIIAGADAGLSGTYTATVAVLDQQVEPIAFDERALVDGSIDIALDSDLYEFEGSAGEAVSLEVSALNAGCARSDHWDLRVQLIAPDNSVVGDAWPGNYGCQGYGPWELPTDGTYGLRIHGGDGSPSLATTGTYTTVLVVR